VPAAAGNPLQLAIRSCLPLCYPTVPLKAGATVNQQLNVHRLLWEPQVLLAEACVTWHEAMDSGAAPSNRQFVATRSQASTPSETLRRGWHRCTPPFA
jgi:hypothetical protein